jgi:uncharacterized membrane protein
MSTKRLEAFSDGVMAVIITIMVLALKVPQGDSLAALAAIWPDFLAYLLSFVYVGVYWNNHHHLMQTVKRATAGVMWANLHVLFWLSLFPMLTAWVGYHPNASWPAAFYGVVLLGASVAWLILEQAIMRGAGDGTLSRAIGGDLKGKLSAALYALGVGLAFVRPWIADIIYALVAAIWVVPDRRIEKRLSA